MSECLALILVTVLVTAAIHRARDMITFENLAELSFCGQNTCSGIMVNFFHIVLLSSSNLNYKCHPFSKGGFILFVIISDSSFIYFDIPYLFLFYFFVFWKNKNQNKYQVDHFK